MRCGGASSWRTREALGNGAASASGAMSCNVRPGPAFVIPGVQNKDTQHSVRKKEDNWYCIVHWVSFYIRLHPPLELLVCPLFQSGGQSRVFFNDGLLVQNAHGHVVLPADDVGRYGSPHV